MNEDIIKLFNEKQNLETALIKYKNDIAEYINTKKSELNSYQYKYCYNTYGTPHFIDIDIDNNNVIVKFEYQEGYDNACEGDTGPCWSYTTCSTEIIINIPNNILFSDIKLGKWLDLELFKQEINDNKNKINICNENILKKLKEYNRNINYYNEIIEELQCIVDNYKD